MVVNFSLLRDRRFAARPVLGKFQQGGFTRSPVVPKSYGGCVRIMVRWVLSVSFGGEELVARSRHDA